MDHDYNPYNDEAEAYEAYDVMLDDVYGSLDVAGFTFDTSRALKELDPSAYQCGFLDWLDSVQRDMEDE